MKMESWELITVTHTDVFPLPRIEETLTTLTRAEWFSTLDMASGYCQVKMDPQDQEKTNSNNNCQGFSWSLTHMPFGLCYAPATYQQLMSQCLSGQLSQSLVVYLNDIIISLSLWAMQWTRWGKFSP